MIYPYVHVECPKVKIGHSAGLVYTRDMKMSFMTHEHEQNFFLNAAKSQSVVGDGFV